MWRLRYSGLCSWTAVLLFYTVSVHVQGVQSQSATTDLPVATLPSTRDPTTAPASTPNPPTPHTVPDSPSTVTNSPSSTVQLTTSDSPSSTSDRTSAAPPVPTPTPDSPTPTPDTSPQIATTGPELPTTTPEITTRIPTTTPEPPTAAPTTTPQITTTDLPATTHESTTTTPQSTTSPEITTPIPSAPTTTPEPPTTTPTTTPQIITTSLDLPATTPETTPIPSTTPEPPTTIPSTTPETTPIPTTTTELPTTSPTTTPETTHVPTTTPEIITPIPPIPSTTPDVPTTVPIPTTTPEITTVTTTTDLPTTTPDITTPIPPVPTTTPESPTTVPATTPQIISTSTDLPSTPPQITTTDAPTTISEITTTDVVTTTVDVPTTTTQITTTNAPVTTPQITTTAVSTTLPQIIIGVTPDSSTPEPPTTNPTGQTTTSVLPTTTPAPTTTPERTTTIPTTTPTPTTTPYSPTTVPQIVTTTPDVPTTPPITTATTNLQTTTPENTTPIPPIPSTIPDIPTTVPIPTTTPEITTVPRTTDLPTTTPEITTPIPTTTPQPTTTPETTIPIPTTTPEPPTTTTTPQIITTSTDAQPTTNAPIPTTTPESLTTIPDNPTTSPQPASTGGPLVVVSPVDNTGLTTTEIGNSTTVPPRDVDLWMPIVAGVGASMVVLIIVIIIIACVTCCNRPVQLDEKYLTDEEEMLPLGKTNGTAGRAPREKRSDRPDRNSTARKKTDTKPKNAEKYRVKESYKSEAEDQISLVKGEEVEVINKPTDDWWFGRSQNKIGWFPTKHLQSAGSVTPTGADNAGFVNDEDSSSLPDPPPSLQATPPPSITAGSDATLPARAIVETSDDDIQQRRPSLSNLSLPPPPPELLAHEDETAPAVRSPDNISIGSVSTSASLRNMSLGTLDLSESRQTTPPNGRSDSPESLASTAQSVSSSRPPSRASYVSRTPSTLGSPNIPWMGSVGRSHVRTHPRVKAVLKNGQPDPAEENRMHLIMNTNLPDRDASMRGSRRSSEDRSGRDRKLSMALRLSEPESALELDLPPPPPEFDSPKPADVSPLAERYIAVYAYRATDDNQLNLEEDDVITVNERDPLGWARGVCIQTGKEGWFPESYVKKLGEDKKDSKATRANGPPQRPAPKPPTDKAKRAEAEPSSVPDPSVQSGQDTLTRPQLRPRPSVRKSLMNKQPSVKGPSEVFYSPSDADDGPGRPTVAVRPSSHEHPAPLQQNRGTFGAPPPPIQSEKSPTYSTAERKLSVRASGPPVQGSVQESAPVKPPRQPSQRHSVATTPKPPTIVRSPSRRVSMPINFDLLEESSIDDTPGQGSHKSRRPPNLNLGSFPPHPQQETGPTSPLSRSRPSRSSVTAAPDIMKTLEELDLQDTQLRTAIETFTMRGPGYLNFTKGDVILELEESDIPGWSYGELQDGTRGIFPVSSTENAATFV